jgi:hypothetical protein
MASKSLKRFRGRLIWSYLCGFCSRGGTRVLQGFLGISWCKRGEFAWWMWWLAGEFVVVRCKQIGVEKCDTVLGFIFNLKILSCRTAHYSWGSHFVTCVSLRVRLPLVAWKISVPTNGRAERSGIRSTKWTSGWTAWRRGRGARSPGQWLGSFRWRSRWPSGRQGGRNRG